MTRLSFAISIGAALLASAQAPADAWKSQSFAVKRQMVSQVIDCMKKRMSSNRLISYNDAAKLCKDEVARRFESAPAGPLVAADSGPK
jgi:hypothetical protein